MESDRKNVSLSAYQQDWAHRGPQSMASHWPPDLGYFGWHRSLHRCPRFIHKHCDMGRLIGWQLQRSCSLQATKNVFWTFLQQAKWESPGGWQCRTTATWLVSCWWIWKHWNNRMKFSANLWSRKNSFWSSAARILFWFLSNIFIAIKLELGTTSATFRCARCSGHGTWWCVHHSFSWTQVPGRHLPYLRHGHVRQETFTATLETCNQQDMCKELCLQFEQYLT